MPLILVFYGIVMLSSFLLIKWLRNSLWEVLYQVSLVDYYPRKDFIFIDHPLPYIGPNNVHVFNIVNAKNIYYV